MDSTEALRHALNITETAIASSSLVGTWVGVSVGLLAVIFAVGLVILGIRYWSDRELVEKRVKQAVSEESLALQLRYDKKFEDERAALKREVESVRKEIAYVWIRNVVTSDNKDLQAIMKAIETQMGVGNKDYVVAMVQELHSYGTRNPEQVGFFLWDGLKVDELLERVKSFFASDEDKDNLRIVTDYAKILNDLAAVTRRARAAKGPKA